MLFYAVSLIFILTACFTFYYFGIKKGEQLAHEEIKRIALEELEKIKKIILTKKEEKK